MTRAWFSGANPWAKRVLLGLAALGALELGLSIFHAKRGPNAADWAQLPGQVAETRQEGDVVIVSPSWADPLARKALGDAVFPLRDVARPDISRYRTALEIGMLGQTSPELAGFREISKKQSGPFTLRRLENPSFAPIVFDFVDELHQGRTDVRLTSPETPCPFNANARPIAGGLGGHPTFPAQRFECPGAYWYNISQTVIADRDFRPRRCIWAHPPTRGEMVVRFSRVPLGSVLRGHGGMYWVIERDRKGTPVVLTVRIDGEEVGRYEHKDGDGWSPFEMPLGAHAHKKNASVEFGVSSSNNAFRHFCFEANSR